MFSSGKFSTICNETNSRHFYQIKTVLVPALKIRENLTYTSFQVLTKTRTLFTTFSLESWRTQALISLECKSRLTSCVIFTVGTLVTSVL